MYVIGVPATTPSSTCFPSLAPLARSVKSDGSASSSSEGAEELVVLNHFTRHYHVKSGGQHRPSTLADGTARLDATKSCPVDVLVLTFRVLMFFCHHATNLTI